MPLLSSKISVVIPYYQTSPEPLAKALCSVFSQRAVATPNIIIVDDGSPVSACEIVDKYFSDKRDYIRIIRQANSGAPTARNRGLENLPKSTEYVAFIDSDDEWAVDHLKNALEALEKGYDFYFADHKRVDWHISKFQKAELDLNQHTSINARDTLFKYNGSLLLPIVSRHLIQTSTVVFNLNCMAGLRFLVNLKVNDDEIFWIQASKRARQIAFCKDIEAFMGRGVNISQTNSGITDKSFELIYQNSLFWRDVRRLFPDESGLEGIAIYRKEQLNKELAAVFFHCLKRRKHIPYETVLRYIVLNPKWCIVLLKTVVRHLVHRL